MYVKMYVEIVVIYLFALIAVVTNDFFLTLMPGFYAYNFRPIPLIV